MSDILCAKCGEPWDSYGIGNGDMTAPEARRFRKGEGCPCCGFGTLCTQCGGSGVSNVHFCPHQCMSGKILAWMPMIGDPHKQYCDGNWYTGYRPNVKVVPEDAIKLREAGTVQSADGPIRQAWFRCPFHKKEDEMKCPHCEGDGKFHSNDPNMEMKALESAIEASDVDPFIIIEERNMG